ncbi:molybdopterin converting factor subunit 1 [Microbulbifer halophilus]|uniref:Molybdopterin synthase sulfur carrier subunit n=1 Tax=Microbulbifer halophilus TaxID=453963 RepID=A0ABW5ECB7_9GAMM|nr:molybdopterin converting factor subunit 1 [Microbulbifer halophilus]MCW8125819.1 molybdopterin converting factor subunit 1 [Microbulbifer halophilus]
MIRVLFFAGLRERLQCAEVSVPASECSTLAELRSHLSERGGEWRSALADDKLQMALNRSVAEPHSAVDGGDEVAFFPPVTGG